MDAIALLKDDHKLMRACAARPMDLTALGSKMMLRKQALLGKRR
ncbi:MAG: hypothetical protein ACREPX_12130 [Rhodanobacteraceae bacterium]